MFLEGAVRVFGQPLSYFMKHNAISSKPILTWINQKKQKSKINYFQPLHSQFWL
jgi:hypothetical protein